MAKSTRGGRRGADNGKTTAGGKAADDADSTVALGLQDLARAWADYAHQVMGRTTEATEALLKCQTFNDMLGVQAELMRGHLQAFLDHSTKLAEITNRMAARSIDAMQGAAEEKTADKNRRN
jgi:hypothetical protein